MSELKLNDVKKAYGKVEVIHGVDLDVQDGELIVFVGPSGCGKSTLLRMIAGLEEITGGDVIIGNEVVNNLTPAERGIAMVFQSYALYPHKNVEDNMGFALKHAGEDKAKISERVQDAATLLGLEPLLNRKPKELSGGQRQRVAIGRAIVRDPKIFLFDEPLSNLDAELRAQMRVEILKLHQRLKTTMIYVTHDQVEAMTLADRIVVLKDGLIEQVGSPMELYQNPTNQFVAGFIGSPKMNFLSVDITETDDQTATVKMGDGSKVTLPIQAKTGKATLGLRPEHVHVQQDSDFANTDTMHTIRGSINVVELLGGETMVHLHLDNGDEMIVKVEGSRSEFLGNQHGKSVTCSFDVQDAFLFDESGETYSTNTTA